ncbi:MAG: DUF4172 domain-containing protein [Pseudobdellovibrionaceae bacterium]
MKAIKYVWQDSYWPNFEWDDAKILPFLSVARRK